MTSELFVKQLDGCDLCGNPNMGGLNCTCAAMAMWLFRASQGKVTTTSCHVRDLANDCKDGTNLEQMTAIADHYGIKGYTLARPTTMAHVEALAKSGRYGIEIDIDYSPLAGTVHDCFRERFFGSHAVFISSGTATTARYGDPGADNRDGKAGGIPNGYQNIDWGTLTKAAGMLVIDASGETMNSRYGYGHVFALITPADPIPTTTKVRVTIRGLTALYNKPYGTHVRNVLKASYICEASKVSGLWWYKIISRVDGSLAANRGLYFKPNRYTSSTRI